jgi:hypothetical protein
MPVIRRQPWIWSRGTAAAFVLFGVLAAIAAALALLARWGGGRSAVRQEERFIAEKEDKEGEKEDKEGFTDCKSLTRDGQEVMECGPDRNFPGKLFFHDKSKSSKPNWDPAKGFQADGEFNGSDPYYLEKIEASGNNSALRLTINDDADESFQIWGNACAAGDCFGAGLMQHKFRADGAAEHAGTLTSQGLMVNGKMTVKKGDGNWNWLRVEGNHKDNVYLGSDGGNRGIWADGPRDFSIYNQGARGLSVKPNGVLEAPVQIQTNHVHAKGRQHLSADERMYLLPKDGVIVGKEWGGNGNLSVQGDQTIGGKLCLGGTCISEADIKGFGRDGTSGMTVKGPLVVNGPTAHAGQVVVGYPHTKPWGFNFGMHALNQVTGGWTHFPWADGRNYIRGELQVDGRTNINSSLQVNGELNVVGKVVTPAVQLGNKWVLSGDGDAHGNDYWLRLHNVQDGKTSTSFGNYVLKNGASGNGQFGGVAAGQFWSGSGAYHVGSDRRIKDDIREISAGDVAKFDKLRPVEYTLKADVNKEKHFGLVAQDVESTYPELVHDGPDGIKSINYSQITPLVVAKLQSMGERMQTEQLCVGDVCVTADDLRRLKG